MTFSLYNIASIIMGLALVAEVVAVPYETQLDARGTKWVVAPLHWSGRGSVTSPIKKQCKKDPTAAAKICLNDRKKKAQAIKFCTKWEARQATSSSDVPAEAIALLSVTDCVQAFCDTIIPPTCALITNTAALLQFSTGPARDVHEGIDQNACCVLCQRSKICLGFYWTAPGDNFPVQTCQLWIEESGTCSHSIQVIFDVDQSNIAGIGNCAKTT